MVLGLSTDMVASSPRAMGQSPLPIARLAAYAGEEPVMSRTTHYVWQRPSRINYPRGNFACGYYLADKGTDLRTMRTTLATEIRATPSSTRVSAQVRGVVEIGQCPPNGLPRLPSPGGEPVQVTRAAAHFLRI